MSLVARHLEENGLPTVVFSNARDITEFAGTPRALFTNYPLGNPCGRPFDPANQLAILKQGIELLTSASAGGTIVDTDFVWSESIDWMRLIFSEEQPFLSEEAEARRLADIQNARTQKGS